MKRGPQVEEGRTRLPDERNFVLRDANGNDIEFPVQLIANKTWNWTPPPHLRSGEQG